jgi:hypothetical protein
MRFMEQVNRRAGKAIIRVIKNQIRQHKPPETRETFDRLLREGYPKDEAYRLLGCVLTAEIYDMMEQEHVFDESLYVERLQALPKLPWEESPDKRVG